MYAHVNIQNAMKLPGVLCFTFNVASHADMMTLGESYGQLILPNQYERKNDVVRAGLCGSSKTGKSTFVTGFLRNLPYKDVLEENTRTRQQQVWQGFDAGFIRHYDAMITVEKSLLPSYLHNDVSSYSPLRTDLAEHAYCDLHDKNFDHLLYFELALLPARDVHLVIPFEDANSSAFQYFLNRNAWMNTAIVSQQGVILKPARSGLQAALLPAPK